LRPKEEIMTTRTARRMALVGTLLGPAVASAQIDDATRLWRVELRITVCDRDEAGTDARITAGLGGEATILNRGEDDFRRGRTYAYDLRPPATVGDLRELRITNEGRDALCMAAVALAVNHPTAALRDDFTIFTDTTTRWISRRPGDAPAFVVDRAALRRSPTWNLAGARVGIADLAALFVLNPIERAEIVQIIESIVGDAIARVEEIGWGRRSHGTHVELTTETRREPRAPNVARVDLDLGKRGRDTRRKAIDVDFSLIVACTASRLEITTTNFHVEARGLAGGRVWERQIRDRLQELGAGLSRSIEIGSEVSCDRLNPRFDGRGNLRLV
jgi:hypothetical protein